MKPNKHQTSQLTKSCRSAYSRFDWRTQFKRSVASSKKKPWIQIFCKTRHVSHFSHIYINPQWILIIKYQSRDANHHIYRWMETDISMTIHFEMWSDDVIITITRKWAFAEKDINKIKSGGHVDSASPRCRFDRRLVTRPSEDVWGREGSKEKGRLLKMLLNLREKDKRRIKVRYIISSRSISTAKGWLQRCFYI